MNKLVKLLSLLFFFAAGSASAYTVTYKAVDLTDTTVGEDLWQYRYVIGGNFDAFDAVEIIFDADKYSALDGDSAVGPWTVLITQPDPALPAEGLVLATANEAVASPADEVVIDFIWLGGASGPGAQRYRVLDDGFDEIDNGTTRLQGTQVPEPASIALLLATGVALVGAARGRRMR